MKHCYNANEMQCMMIYNHLHKTHPKNFTKTSSILKNPKKISKTQNLDLNAWNAWRMSKRELAKWFAISKRPKITWVEGFEREVSVWEVKILSLSREIGKKWRKNHAEPLYRKVLKLDRSRGVEIKNVCFICRRAVQHLLRGVHS